MLPNDNERGPPAYARGAPQFIARELRRFFEDVDPARTAQPNNMS